MFSSFMFFSSTLQNVYFIIIFDQFLFNSIVIMQFLISFDSLDDKLLTDSCDFIDYKSFGRTRIEKIDLIFFLNWNLSDCF